jgi:hypothetical protein
MIDAIKAFFAKLFGKSAQTTTTTARAVYPAPQAQSGLWTIAFSPGMPGKLRVAPEGHNVALPTKDGLHYVYTKATKPLVPGQSIGMVFRIEGDGTIVPVAKTDAEKAEPARMRLYIQAKNDTMQDVDANKRWWSKGSENLNVRTRGAEYGWNERLDPADWFNMHGQNGATRPEAFYTALKNVQHVGMTFGGMFAGHGVFVQPGTGSARFVLVDWLQ